MKDLLNRITAAKLSESTLFVPQWDATIGVRELTAGQRLDFASGLSKDASKAYAGIVISCCFDPETGADLFEPAHRDKLLASSGAAIDLIASEIVRLSKMTTESAEQTEKN